MTRSSRRRLLALTIVLLAVVSCSSAGIGRRSSPSSALTTDASAGDENGRTPGTAGCGQPLPADLHGPDGRADDVERMITSGGSPRTYRLGIPRDSDNRYPQPLVLDLHGSGSNAIQQTAYSQLPGKAGARGYVVVTPDAIAGQWELFPTDGSKGRDLELAKALLAEVESRYCVDRQRVFATGISLGSALATDLACTLPDQIAAVGNVAEEVVFPPCERALPVIAFHGDADAVVPYREGDVPAGRPNAGLPGTEHNLARWAALAHCDPVPVVTDVGTEVVHSVWPGCAAGSAVELYTIKGGGHTWPGSPVKVGYLGFNTDQIDASALILDFFDAHPLRQP